MSKRARAKRRKEKKDQENQKGCRIDLKPSAWLETANAWQLLSVSSIPLSSFVSETALTAALVSSFPLSFVSEAALSRYITLPNAVKAELCSHVAAMALLQCSVAVVVQNTRHTIFYQIISTPPARSHRTPALLPVHAALQKVWHAIAAFRGKTERSDLDASSKVSLHSIPALLLSRTASLLSFLAPQHSCSPSQQNSISALFLSSTASLLSFLAVQRVTSA